MTTRVRQRCFMEGEVAVGLAESNSLSKPLIVPVYVRYRFSNSSVAHHFPGGCHRSCSLDMPSTADSRARASFAMWVSIALLSRFCTLQVECCATSKHFIYNRKDRHENDGLCAVRDHHCCRSR